MMVSVEVVSKHSTDKNPSHGDERKSMGERENMYDELSARDEKSNHDEWWGRGNKKERRHKRTGKR
jgi:hypothetical protein